MNAPHTAIAASLVLAAAAAHAGPVSVDSSCNPRITQIEARLVQKAAQGPDALRNFVVMRHDIWQLDVRGSADRVREIEAARAGCLSAASAAPEATLARK
jgi:hypothetical protein